MKKLIFAIILLVILLIVALIKCQPIEKPAPKPIVKLGATLPLTGDMAFMGDAIRKGITFAIVEINSNPDNKFFYEAVFEDDQLKPQKSVMNTRKMINIDKINTLFTVFSTPAVAVNPIVEENKIIAFHGALADLASEGKYNFRNLVNLKDFADTVTKFTKQQKSKKAALLFQNTPASIEVYEMIEKSFKKNKIDYDLFLFNQADRDFKILSLKVKSYEPDIIIYYGSSPELELFAKDINAQNIEAPKIAMGLVNPENNALDGYYIINSSEGDDEFRKKFDYLPTYYAPYFYDAVHIITDVYERLGKIDATKVPSSDEFIKELYKKRNYQGTVGDIKLSNNGSFDSKAALYQIKDQKLETVAIK